VYLAYVPDDRRARKARRGSDQPPKRPRWDLSFWPAVTNVFPGHLGYCVGPIDNKARMRHSSLLDQRRRVDARLGMIHHSEQVTRNVSRTRRFFGISRTQFYIWVR
jgi:hypothetical protein